MDGSHRNIGMAEFGYMNGIPIGEKPVKEFFRVLPLELQQFFCLDKEGIPFGFGLRCLIGGS